MSELLYLDFPEFFVSNFMFAKQPKATSKKQQSKHNSQRPSTMSTAHVPHTLLYTPVPAGEELDSLDSLDLEKESMVRQMSSDSLSTSGSTLGKPDSEAGEKKRFTFDARFISDAIIGLSDGLTVPFALTAGLSALGDTKVVIFGGLAELTAGAISMGLGGYLGAKSEEESYRATETETCDLALHDPITASAQISSTLAEFSIPQPTIDEITLHLRKSSPKLFASFLLRFQHTLSEPPQSRAITCALTIAIAYFLGGLVPLLPYFFLARIDIALIASIVTMIVALFTFGYTKTGFVTGWSGGRNVWKAVVGGGQMVVVGSLAAGSAMGLVKAFQALAHSS